MNTTTRRIVQCTTCGMGINLNEPEFHSERYGHDATWAACPNCGDDTDLACSLCAEFGAHDGACFHGSTVYVGHYPSGRVYAACGAPHPSGNPRCGRPVDDAGQHSGRTDIGHMNDLGNQWAESYDSVPADAPLASNPDERGYY